MRTLEITTKISKCLNCHFCPQEALGNAYLGNEKLLSLDNFLTALSKLPKHVQIHFSGFSEPFLNQDCGRMINLASLHNFKIHLYTTLMGLTEEQASWIVRSNIDVIRLHVPDGKHLKISNELWLRQLDLFLTLKKPFTAMAMGEIDPALNTILDSKGITVELPNMLSRGGNLWNPRRIEGKLKCSMNRWNSNVMLPNGDVYLCCMDYALSSYCGNLFRQGYETIFQNGSSFKILAESGSAPEICRKCEWAQPL